MKTMFFSKTVPLVWGPVYYFHQYINPVAIFVELRQFIFLHDIYSNNNSNGAILNKIMIHAMYDHNLNTQKKYSLFLNTVKPICIAAIIVFQLACSNNTNSVPLTNLEVFYEKDTVLKPWAEDIAWDDIIYLMNYNFYDSVNDYFNFICLQKPQWEKIKNLSDIELNSPSPKKINHIWVKGFFYNIDDIYKVLENYRGIYLEYIYGRKMVLINNILLGLGNTDRMLDAYLPQQYIIPNRTLVQGENIVYIRLEISSQRGIGKKANIFIQPEGTYYLTKFWTTFYRNIIYILYLFLLIILAIIIFNTVQSKEISRFLLFLFVIVIYSSANLVLIIPINLNYTVLANLLNLVHYIYIVFFALFFQMYAGIYLKRENKVLFSILGIYTLCSIIPDYLFSVAHYKSLTFFYSSLSISAFLAGLIITGYILHKLNNIVADRFKYHLFLSALFVFSAHTIIEFITFKTGYLYWPHQITTYLFPMYLMVFAVYITIELMKKRMLAQEMNTHLAKEKAGHPSELTITESCKEKLDYVIEFINENYKEAISREGLAAEVDINVNYLSSLFKIYTGEKFHEYINTLRIKEAAKMLSDTDQKIIDIAFSVGFENQSTFIRIFKERMGKTPSEYRSEKRPQHT